MKRSIQNKKISDCPVCGGTKKVKVIIIGLIDNMSYFKADDGKKYPIFGEGGVKKTAEEFEKDLIG